MGADMELVRQFNSEMASIYENKPPISKAKMASITRFAVKALKFYKHIVHAVEKFLQKCHADYKLPGLYVLDSIIRQSRHQFGLEKDLFGPRFQKNITFLFQNIYQCPQEEKPKVVRVLNLWQRNGIYPPEVISPLVDMASTSSKVLAASIHKQKKKKSASLKPELDDMSFDHTNSFLDDSLPLPMEPGESKRDKKRIQVSQDDEIQVLKAQLEQQRKQQELLQQQLQMQIMATKQQALQLQLQQQQMQNKIQEQMQQSSFDVLKTAAVELPPTATVAAAALATQNNNQMQLFNQIQELTQQLEKDKAALASLTNTESTSTIIPPIIPPQINTAENHSQFLENFQQLIQSAKGIMLKDPRQQNNSDGKSHQEESSPKFNQALLDTFEYDEDIGDEQRIQEQKNRLEEEQNRLKRQDRDHRDPRSMNNDEQPPTKKLLMSNFAEGNHQVPEHSMQQSMSQDDDAMQIDNDSEEYNEDELYQPEQSSVEESLQRKHPWPPIEINRREDRNVAEEEQERNARQAREAEKMAREAEENWKKEKSVMPPPMMNRLTVASTTLWIGRLPRGTHPGMLQSLFSEHGEVKNIDMIEMRGCAFVTMATRFNADRALRHLRNRRIDGCDVKVAWGQPKNLQEFGKFWDESFGCSFIPWGAFKPFHLRFFMDGAIVDKETLPSGVDVPNKGPTEEPAPVENNPVIPPRMPPFHRGMPNPAMPNPGMPNPGMHNPGMPNPGMPNPGMPNPGMPNPGMTNPGMTNPGMPNPGMPNPGMPPQVLPTHGLPGLPHPDMLPPPPPPMMPPGFRGQFPPLPMPGMLPLGMRPPMPPVGLLPWPGNLQPPRGLAPGIPGNHQPPILPKPALLPPDQIRTQQQNGREVLSLLPQPPPLPGAPPNIRGPPFPRPDGPPISMAGRPGFVPIPRTEAPFNRPPSSERPRFQPPQPEIRPPIVDIPRSMVEQPGLPPAPPIQLPQWSSNNNVDKKEEPLQEKLPLKEFCHSTGSNDMLEQLKDEKMDEKMDRRDDQGLDQGRNRTPEKSKDERDRRNRDEYRDSERKDKKERPANDNRRDDRNDRRDRDREDRRERDDRDERRDRDYRADRNRKGRDDRNDRGERDYRNRDDRDNRRAERGGGREKYGKDEFGRDESIREEDRNRRDDFNRDEDRNRRDEIGREDDKTRRRDRSPEKSRSRESDSGKEKARESYKLDEVSSSSDKKEFPLDIKGQGLPGFKSTMQPISEKNESKTSPQLPTVKSGFKSTMQPVTDGFKSTMQPVTDGFKSTMQPVADVTATDEYKTIAPTGNKSVSSTGKKNKAKAFIPFSIFPFPMHSEEDDEDNAKGDESENDGKEDTGTPTQKDMEGDSVNNNAQMCDTEDQADDNKDNQKDELYDPLDLASPSSPEAIRGSHLTEELHKMEDGTQDPALSESTINENLQTDDDRVDIDSSAVDIAADNNASPDDNNVLPDRGSPLNDNPQLSMFENTPTVGQSADIVTSSGDHLFSENASVENNSLVEPSSGIVSSSVDPPFKEDSKGNTSSESSADIVTSSVDQVMDTSVHIDKPDSFNVNDANDGDLITMPTSTTAVDISDTDHKVARVSGINSSDANKPCSTEALCESSDILGNKSISTGSNQRMGDKNVDSHMRIHLKSPEYNSQVSTSNTVAEENPSSNPDVSSKSDIHSDSNADSIAGEGTANAINTKDCEPESEVNSEGNTRGMDEK